MPKISLNIAPKSKNGKTLCGRLLEVSSSASMIRKRDKSFNSIGSMTYFP